MFHKEGYKIILLTFFLSSSVVILSDIYINNFYLRNSIQIFTILEFCFILNFFRDPKRKINLDPDKIISSVDGEIHNGLWETYPDAYFGR